MRFRIIWFITVLLTVLPLMARAETNTVRPWAPWMTFRDGMDESIRNPAPVARTTGTRAYTSAKMSPSSPVMTPRDTLDVIHQMYDGTPLRLSALEDAYSKRIIDEVR